MQLTNRVKRNPGSQSSTNSPSQASQTSSGGGIADPPASFDDWLDGRLKTLYQAVLNEPLPPEIAALLGGQKKSDGPK
jgi:hypothetical protein